MKLGLVLEGGASRTYFTNGVLDALIDANIRADIVIGSSAGIANGMSYVSWQKGRNLELGQKYMHDKRYMGVRHLLNPKNKSLYNLDFVYRDLPKTLIPFDYEAMAEYPGKVYACLTNVETGKAEYIEVPKNAADMETVMIATCALPILFQPVEYKGKIYMDGGITDPIPVDFPIKNGCDKNIVVITRERDYVKKDDSTFSIASRKFKKYTVFSEALKNRAESYNKHRRHLDELEKEGKVFLIAPENTDGWGRTESDPDVLTKWYNDGYEMMQKRMGELKEYLGI